MFRRAEAFGLACDDPYEVLRPLDGQLRRSALMEILSRLTRPRVLLRAQVFALVMVGMCRVLARLY